MLDFLNKLVGGRKTDYKELVTNGAIILDVRTSSEYKTGHIQGSVNIPVQELQQKIRRLSKSKAIITCCASGMRSASAKSMLKSAGFVDVYNGGSWSTLKNNI